MDRLPRFAAVQTGRNIHTRVIRRQAVVLTANPSPTATDQMMCLSKLMPNHEVKQTSQDLYLHPHFVVSSVFI